MCLNDKFIRGVVHELHKFSGSLQDGGPSAPGNNGSEETGNFNVFFLRKTVRNADGVFCNEKRQVVLLCPAFQKLFYVQGSKFEMNKVV